MSAKQISTQRDSAAAGLAVTPDDDAVIQRTRALYVGTSGGDLVVVPALEPDGTPGINALTIPNAPVGYHPLQVIKVLGSTGVSNIVALY